MKKLFRSALLIMLIFSFVISIIGCGGGKGSGDTNTTAASGSQAVSGQPEAQEQAAADSPTTFKELKELTIYAIFHSSASVTGKDYNDNEAFKELEKRTGVHVNWIHPPSGQESEKFTLLIAGGEYPDIIQKDWDALPGGAVKYFDEGVILKLNELIDKAAPNYKKILEENDEARKQVSGADGSIYYVSRLRLDNISNVYMGPKIRKDWLDKLNMKVPETIDELYAALTAFKANDMNGNGDKNDEIPYTAQLFSRASNGGYSVWALGKLLWPFGTHYDFYQDNGKVKYGPLEPEYRQGMEYIIKLYSEGLIDTDFLIQDRAKMDAKIDNDQVGALYGFQPTKYFQNAEKRGNTSFNLVGMPHLKGPSGKAKCFETEYASIPLHLYDMAISTQAKYPEETMKWLDYAYSEEGNLLFNFGLENVSYKMENGYPKFTDEIMKNPKELTISQANAKYCMSVNGWIGIADPRNFEQMTITKYSEQPIKTWKEVDISGVLLPTIPVTPEENEKIVERLPEITTYVDEMMAKFVLGTEPMSKYDDFVNNLKKMGIEELISIKQAALDRYNKK